MKITQLRKKKDGQTAMTVLTMDDWLARMKEETKEKPVGEFRLQLRYVLPDEVPAGLEALPRILPAVEYGRSRGGRYLKQYNGVVELTVGPLSGRSEVELVKQRVWQLPQTRCVFMGSSGRSVKIWTTFTRPDNTLPTSEEEAELFHAHAYRLAVQCYQPHLPFQIVPREPRIDGYSRLSFDPEVLYRPDSVQFYLTQPVSLPAETTYAEHLQAEESPWKRTVPGFEQMEAVALLHQAALCKARVEVGEARRAGTLPAGNDLHPVLVSLAQHCAASGLPEEESVHRTLFYFHRKVREELIRSIFRDAYNEANGTIEAWTLLPKEQRLAMQLEEFMKRRYELRYNTQIGEVEYRERYTYRFHFLPMDKRALNSIAIDAQKEGIPLWDRDINRYVYSNRVPTFNPLEEYLYGLPHWDGRNRIDALADTVPCNYPKWRELFHRWFLNMVVHWRGGVDKKYANSVSPLLVGAQGTRKSTFCRNLVPPELRTYYTDSIDFSRKKDAELCLNRFALINIDEFDQISVTQQGFLKHILQKPVLNVRKPYGTAMLEMQRYASFIATSNQKDLLTDPSGSRRFICVEVTGQINTSPIDYEQLYAQAMYELEQGERYWFDYEDEQVMTEHNREFEQNSPEEQLFFSFFRAADEDEAGEWLSTTEIMERLVSKSNLKFSDKKVRLLGRTLAKHKLPSRHSRYGTLYHLVQVN